ncbi:MAG: replicative DNA helicase [Clostridia bacterium]|nr:replicative DNA helicase [Clostridia bacterium]
MALDTELLRQIPFSMDAEMCVLGCVLIEPQSFPLAAERISADDFYIDKHRILFRAMSAMFAESRTLDVVTLLDRLTAEEQYDAVGGRTYVRQLVDAVPFVGNLEDYIRIVRDKALLRRLIDTANQISEEAYRGGEDSQMIVDHAETLIYQVSRDRDVAGFTHISRVLDTNRRELTELAKNLDAIRGVQTGFATIDDVIVEMGKSDLLILACRPGMGKTSFALNIAGNLAVRKHKTVAIFSLEMSKEQLALRLLSSEAMVDSKHLRSGRLDTDEWNRLANTMNELSATEIYIDDTANITVNQMKAKLRRMRNLDFVIIDYLQLMHGDRNTDNRVVEVGDISRGLKILAKELDVPVLCCAQLSRGVESRGNKQPMLSDLRESGSIEQDADMVWFLHRDNYYDQSDPAQDNSAMCIVAKNRHGRTGKADLLWFSDFTKFASPDTDHFE